MKTKNPATAVLRHAKKLLKLIPPNLALEAEAFEELECLIGAALARVKAIRGGLFTVENAPKPPSEEQWRAAVAHFQPPTPEQIAELERFMKGPTRSDKRRFSELTKRRTLLEKKLQGVEAQLQEIRPLLDEGDRRVEQERDKSSILDDAVRGMAKRGLTPGEISRSLREMFEYRAHAVGADAATREYESRFGKLEGVDGADISTESLSEKAVNARLFRLRVRGFNQPVSPTARNRRKSKKP